MDPTTWFELSDLFFHEGLPVRLSTVEAVGSQKVWSCSLPRIVTNRTRRLLGLALQQAFNFGDFDLYYFAAAVTTAICPCNRALSTLWDFRNSLLRKLTICLRSIR